MNMDKFEKNKEKFWGLFYFYKRKNYGRYRCNESGFTTLIKMRMVIFHIKYCENLERTGYGNKAKNFIFTKDFTGKNR